MTVLFFLLFTIISQVLCGPTIHAHNSTNCDGFQATFDVNKVVGMWQVVAIIPEKLFPDRDVNCYSVEFREIDAGGLRWLINKQHPPTNGTQKDVPTVPAGATVVRQRYYTDHAFDVWSKSVKGVNGCFQQVLSLDTNPNDTQEAQKHDAMMQLHMIETGKKSEPFLIQMLWGRLISVVIYKNTPGVTQDQLKPVFEAMSKLRGPQRLPKICDSPVREHLPKD